LRISELLQNSDRRFLSLEFFPPRDRAHWEAFYREVEALKTVDPLFVSVTYGAGGSKQENTLDLVTTMKRRYDLEPMAHLTCIGATDHSLGQFIDRLGDAQIDNVLALGGDPPADDPGFVANGKYRYASDLVTFIRSQYKSLGVGVAGYPEKHPRAATLEEDIEFLRRKVQCGGDFVVTQLFFDNNLYFDFVDKVTAAGVDKPILPGVMPIFNLKVIKKITSMCGAHIPPSLLAALEEADATDGEAGVEKVGIDFARAQIQDLIDRGAPGVHLYTLNKAEACLAVVNQVELAR
jgi:methylenetetrahydrofolate reductase (NADPH)